MNAPVERNLTSDRQQLSMDRFDAERFSTVYRALADILERQHPDEHMSHRLGDLMRRIFVGTEFDPPDELLEAAVNVLRSNNMQHHTQMAVRLRDHADHLDDQVAGAQQ